jgi:tetratricopeptide (TPR) repeat protein
LLLGILVYAAYGPTLGADFVSWDDPEYVTANPHVQAHDPGRWLEILDPRVLVVHDWTPVVTATHVLERHLIGAGPAVFHATNLLLQLACALAALALLHALGLPRGAALAAAAWWVVHPLQVESVAWVAARKNLLSTLFFLLAARTYLVRTSFGAWTGSFLLFCLAITSKATAVMLPVWLLALHFLRRDRSPRAAALALAPFFLVGLARGLYTLAVQSDPVQDTAALGLDGRLAAMGPVLVTYLRQAFVPSDLALLYPWPALGWGDPRVLGAWLCVALLVAGVAWIGSRDRRFLEIGLLVPVTLAPTLNVLPAPFLQADRYLHLPLVGVAGLLALLVLRPLIARPRLAATVLVAWALVLVPVARARTAVWQNGERLWAHALEVDPGFAPGRSNLALDLLSQGRTDEAVQLLEQAIALEPGRATWRMNLGAALAARGERDRARSLLEEVVAEDPGLADAHGTLAVIALRDGRAEEALAHAKRGVEKRPGDPLLEVHVAEALAALGRREEAIEEYRRIERAYPIAPVLLGWADQERALGRPDQAEALYARLVELEPNQTDALYNLATLRMHGGRQAEALRLFDRLLILDPENAAAHNNRGNVLFATRRFAAAEEAYRTATTLAPGDPRFETNLANTLAVTGRCRDALPLYEAVIVVDPSAALARLNHATCLIQLGRRDEALPELRALHAEGLHRDRIEALLQPSDLGGAP